MKLAIIRWLPTRQTHIAGFRWLLFLLYHFFTQKVESIGQAFAYVSFLCHLIRFYPFQNRGFQLLSIFFPSTHFCFRKGIPLNH